MTDKSEMSVGFATFVLGMLICATSVFVGAIVKAWAHHIETKIEQPVQVKF